MGLLSGLDEAGNVAQADVLRAMFSPAWWYESSHMTVAAFEAVAFAFAAVYAFALLRGRRDEYHKTLAFEPSFLAVVPLVLTSRGRDLAGTEQRRIDREELPPAMQEAPEHFELIEGEMRGTVWSLTSRICGRTWTRER